jgi:hypothetical protein
VLAAAPPEEESMMSSRTIFLSRLIGLYCILVDRSMVLHRQATVDWATAVLNNASADVGSQRHYDDHWAAMVLAHNFWSGGALAML